LGLEAVVDGEGYLHEAPEEQERKPPKEIFATSWLNLTAQPPLPSSKPIGNAHRIASPVTFIVRQCGAVKNFNKALAMPLSFDSLSLPRFIA